MKSLTDLLVIGRHDPIVNGYLILVQKGELSLEQALIEMVFALKEKMNKSVEQHVKHLEKCSNPNIQ